MIFRFFSRCFCRYYAVDNTADDIAAGGFQVSNDPNKKAGVQQYETLKQVQRQR